MSDPSMEDILASIRKILSDETMEEDIAEAAPSVVEEEVAAEPAPPAEPVAEDEDVYALSTMQMVNPEPAVVKPSVPDLVAKPVAKASACTLSYLAQMIAEDRKASLGNSGLTIEEIVRESVRPIIKEWLNQNLYDMVERLVRKEIEKVVDKVQI